ncbi:MAG TPA: hypothetical protein VJ729_12805 [Nitrososphaeraceae archaeon]|nr:hypothetical protein [Nitrososphaeraceae archaeon]
MLISNRFSLQSLLVAQPNELAEIFGIDEYAAKLITAAANNLTMKKDITRTEEPVFDSRCMSNFYNRKLTDWHYYLAVIIKLRLIDISLLHYHLQSLYLVVVVAAEKEHVQKKQN